MRATTLGILLGLAACATPPDPPPTWSGPFDVDHVLTRATAAAGGAAALTLPATVHTRSRVVLYPPNGSPIDAALEYFAEEPDRERRELVTADGHVLIRIVAHGHSFESEDGKPTGNDLSQDDARRRRYRRLLYELSAPAPSAAALIGDPGADPRSAIVVARELAPGERWQAWFDANSLLITRIRCLSRDADGEHVDEDFLSAHERFGARVLPRRQVTWRDGRRVKEAWLVEYEEGIELDPELFEIDAAK